MKDIDNLDIQNNNILEDYLGNKYLIENNFVVCVVGFPIDLGKIIELDEIRIKILNLKIINYTFSPEDVLNAKNIMLKKLKGQVLTQFQAIRDAITFQDTTASKGSDPANKILTDTQIKDWGNYIGRIINYNEDMTDIPFENINITLFGQIPELPEQYMKLF